MTEMAENRNIVETQMQQSGVGVIVIVNTLVHAVLIPVWAILTTYLYLERTGEFRLANE